jgi:hypothetical protein
MLKMKKKSKINQKIYMILKLQFITNPHQIFNHNFPFSFYKLKIL